MKIKAIIFDYDGVILDSFKSIFEVYRVIATECGGYVPKDLEEFRDLYGYHYRECMENLGIGEECFSKADEIFRREIVKQEHLPFPGIDKVIAKLSKKYKLYIVSAAYTEEVTKNLERYDLIKYFQKICCTKENNYNKSGAIEIILKENKLAKDEIMSIGDRTLDYDIAKEVGLADENIIVASYGWGYDKDKVKIANIADKPEDILEIVKKQS